MNRQILLFGLTLLLLSACTRPASDAPPTEFPLNFPTPAPGATPLCQPADLKTSSNWIDTGEALVIGLTLTNQTKNPCTLINPPRAALLDANHQPLDLQVLDLSPAQTPPAPAEMLLAPGESAILSLAWANACQPLKKNELTIHLTLFEKIDLETIAQIGSAPGCKNKTEPSTLTVAPYSYPP